MFDRIISHLFQKSKHLFEFFENIFPFIFLLAFANILYTKHKKSIRNIFTFYSLLILPYRVIYVHRGIGPQLYPELLQTMSVFIFSDIAIIPSYFLRRLSALHGELFVLLKRTAYLKHTVHHYVEFTLCAARIPIIISGMPGLSARYPLSFPPFCG